MAGRGSDAQSQLVRLVSELLKELDGTAVTECEFRAGDHRVHLRRTLSPTPVLQEAGAVQVGAVPESWRPVISPLTGIFYLTESPKGPPLVSVDAYVAEKQVVGLIESMKMYNPVETDLAGIVRSIDAQAGSVVEKGQVLMYIEPTGDIA